MCKLALAQGLVGPGRVVCTRGATVVGSGWASYRTAFVIIDSVISVGIGHSVSHLCQGQKGELNLKCVNSCRRKGFGSVKVLSSVL